MAFAPNPLDIEDAFDTVETVSLQELTDRALEVFFQEKPESLLVLKEDRDIRLCDRAELIEDEVKRVLWQPYFEGIKSAELAQAGCILSFSDWYQDTVKKPRTQMGVNRETVRAWLFYVRQCSDEKRQDYLVGLDNYLTSACTEESLREKYEGRVYGNHTRVTRNETRHQLTMVLDHLIVEVNAMSNIELLPTFMLSEFLQTSATLDDTNYDLIFMITKSGSNSGGHYQYYEKIDNQVINHNDASVSLSDGPQLSATNQGRLMVYRKRA